MTSPPPADAAGVQKAPRHEIAVGRVPAVPQALWGLSHGVWLDEVGGRRWPRSLPYRKGEHGAMTAPAARRVDR